MLAAFTQFAETHQVLGNWLAVGVTCELAALWLYVRRGNRLDTAADARRHISEAFDRAERRKRALGLNPYLPPPAALRCQCRVCSADYARRLDRSRVHHGRVIRELESRRTLEAKVA